MIVGSDKAEQLEETLGFMEKGPFDDDLVEKLNAMWHEAEDVAPRHDFLLKHL